MSRIGRAPVAIPKGVTVECSDSLFRASGPKGSLELKVHPDMRVEVEPEQVLVKRPTDSKNHRALHGLTRALIANMTHGVHEGFAKILELRGVGYRAELQGSKLVLQVGYSHPVEMPIPAGLSLDVVSSTPNSENGYLTAKITIQGIDKQLIGDFASEVRGVRSVEPYKGKGLRYSTEVVRKKLGKAGKAGEGRK